MHAYVSLPAHPGVIKSSLNTQTTYILAFPLSIVSLVISRHLSSPLPHPTSHTHIIIATFTFILTSRHVTSRHITIVLATITVSDAMRTRWPAGIRARHPYPAPMLWAFSSSHSHQCHNAGYVNSHPVFF